MSKYLFLLKLPSNSAVLRGCLIACKNNLIPRIRCRSFYKDNVCPSFYEIEALAGIQGRFRTVRSKNRTGQFLQKIDVTRYRYLPCHTFDHVNPHQIRHRIRIRSRLPGTPPMRYARSLALSLSSSASNVDVYGSSPVGPRIYQLVTRGVKMGLTRCRFDQPHEGYPWYVFPPCNRYRRTRAFAPISRSTC